MNRFLSPRNKIAVLFRSRRVEHIPILVGRFHPPFCYWYIHHTTRRRCRQLAIYVFGASDDGFCGLAAAKPCQPAHKSP